jgi:hypothetical protein
VARALTPPAALAGAALLWLLLQPWRPGLVTDDWAYFDSVVLTVQAGRPVVSDYLGPTTVGLTVPVALAAGATGDV